MYKFTKKELLDAYYTIKKMRLVEEKICEKFQEQEMRTPVHLYIGEEAIGAAFCKDLTSKDIVYSNHRGHGHYIAKGGDINKLIAELYNKKSGCSFGHGGSMHIIDKEVGFGLTSSIVSGNVPIATGEALAKKLKNLKDVVVCFFGDGASEEGCVYECICFAQLKKLPIVYVCENNEYAMYTSFDKREPVDKISDKFSNIIKTNTVNGNNYDEVYEIAHNAIGNARSGKGPSFIECQTYRMSNHYETKGGDFLAFRSQDEYDKWKLKCPIKYWIKYINSEFPDVTRDDLEIINKKVALEVETAFLFAKNSEFPNPDEILKGIFG